MPKRRDIRRLAMQILYQMDLRGTRDHAAIREGLADAEGPDGEDVKNAAFALAEAAWTRHREADKIAAELAPKWPTHRQPPVDRALLRLAYHEMVSGYSPVKVAINEAVELAKEYCSEQSPAFINGVLDKMAKKITPPETPETPAPGESGVSGGKAATGEDEWLRDAMDEPGEEKR